MSLEGFAPLLLISHQMVQPVKVKCGAVGCFLTRFVQPSVANNNARRYRLGFLKFDSFTHCFGGIVEDSALIFEQHREDMEFVLYVFDFF